MRWRADVAAIGLLGIEAGVALTVYSCWPGSERAVNVAGWSADRWPAVGGALAQRRQVALTAGAGDRRIVQEIGASSGVTDLAALVLAPLLRGSLTLGILVVGYRSDNGWHAATWQQHFALCQQFIARAMTNVHAATRLDELPGSGETLAEERANRLATLETERDNAVNEATEARQQAQQALAQLAAERRRANDVATVVETRTQDEAGETRVAELQREIIALRAALREAQRRTAGTVDAGDESGREALINTVNNYAGQLETAWARILELEARAPNGENGFIDGSVATLARNLRTPLTALQGYAELLATSEPATGPRQRQRFLQLLAVDAKRIEDTIGQIEQLAAGAPHQQQGEVVDADSEIETAIDLTLAQIQERRLNLLLEVERGMPSPALRRNELSLILIHLLDNACQASPAGSHVTLVVHMDALQPAGAQEAGNEESFLHLEVRDSGSGIRYQDLPFLFEQQDAGAFSSIAGIGETNVGLVAVNEIVRAGGGRLWAGKAVERGSTYSVLLPIRSSVM